MEDNKLNIKLTNDPLNLSECYRFVVEPSCGGINAFVGTVRQWNKGEEITHLDFESYEPMAIAELEKIAKKAKDQFNTQKICIHHRLGKVAITEIAVIITVSCKHRKAAFQACEFIIDQLKKDVPIWKKEFLSNGSYWVNARP